MSTRPLLGACLCLLAACAVGNGLQHDLAETTAPWLIVDLDTGATTAALEVPDLATSAIYRDRMLVFRRVTTASVVGQASGTFARQVDETSDRVTPGPFYIAAFELTRAQWWRIATTRPWLTLLPAPATSGDDLPALGISFIAARSALAGWRTGHLALPSDRQWETAARSDSTSVFPWGNDHRASIAGLHAVTWDSGGQSGARPVGQRQPNALGLYDMCGNAWELTASGSIRGGSWADALSLARPANRDVIEPDSAHEAVGIRPIYVP